MTHSHITGLAALLVLGVAGAAMAQGSASTGRSMPDSNMAPPSGNSGGANHGVGTQGKLTENAGGHSSTVRGTAGAAQITTHPSPKTSPGSNPRVESDPSQGGGQQR